MSSTSGDEVPALSREEAELLAPWYTTGELSDTEARAIEALARRDPEFARLLEETEGEAEAIFKSGEALGEPPPSVLDRLNASVAAGKRKDPAAHLARGIATAKNAAAWLFAGPVPASFRIAALAMLALCLAEAGLIAYLLAGTGQSPKYVAASGAESTSGAKAAFLVKFSPGATIKDIGATLDDAGAVIVEGPLPDLIYRVGLRDGSPSAKADALRKLKASAAISLVLPQR